MNAQQLYYNTKFENFAQIPVRNLIFLLKKLCIFDLFQKYTVDCRSRIYSLPSLLMVALQILLFRSPSKNYFYQNRRLGRSYRNIGALAHIKEGLFPHSKTIDDAFWCLNPAALEPILFDIFKKLQSAKLFKNHPSLKKNGSYHLAIDATVVHVYYPESQHPCHTCPFCLKRQRKDGAVWYLHMEVIASLIFESGFQLPIYLHRIKKRKEWEELSEEKLKQECEITTLPPILQKIRAYLPKLKITVLLDGLHANQTSLNILKKFNCDYSIVLKRLKSVQQQIDDIGQKIRSTASKHFHLTQKASLTNEIPYANHKLNVIKFDEHAEKKPTKRFAKINSKDVHYQWIISQKIEDIFSTAEGSRLRWREEDLFNTCKRRGFHMQHDYSRHPNSQGIWLLLTLIAFCLTSILLLSDLGIIARKGTAVYFLMQQMLQDLFYLPYETIFLSPYPKNLRFTLFAA